MGKRWAAFGGMLGATALAAVLVTAACGDEAALAPSPVDAAATAPPPMGGDANVDAATPIDGVLLRYGNCEDLAPCGGNPVGARTVIGGCLASKVFDEAKTGKCSGVRESEIRIVAKGDVVVTEDVFTADVDVVLTGKVLFPKECLEEQNLVGQCDLLRIFMTKRDPPLFDRATCVPAPGDACLCDAARDDVVRSSGIYTADAGIIHSESPDSGAPGPQERNYAYCVVGEKMSFQERERGVPFVLDLGPK